MTVWLFDLQVKELVWLSWAFVGCSVGENRDGSLWILIEYGYYRSMFLVEGFSLCILVGFFLTVMRVTPVQSYSDCHLVVVYVSWIAIWLLCVFPESWSWAYSHGLGIKVSRKSVLGWPLCQDICFMVVG
jgi:hypothetical protein